MPHSEDQIPDPNSALFSDDAFSPRIMVQLIASWNNSSQQIVKQMEKMEDTLKVMAENEKTRLVNEANMINHVKRLDTNDSHIESLAKKAMNKADSIQKSINNSCDITKQSIKEDYTRDINSIKSNVKTGWVVFSFMLGGIVILGSLYLGTKFGIYDKTVDLTRSLELKNSKTYQNLEYHKANHPKG